MYPNLSHLKKNQLLNSYQLIFLFSCSVKNFTIPSISYHSFSIFLFVCLYKFTKITHTKINNEKKKEKEKKKRLTMTFRWLSGHFQVLILPELFGNICPCQSLVTFWNSLVTFSCSLSFTSDHSPISFQCSPPIIYYKMLLHLMLLNPRFISRSLL